MGNHNSKSKTNVKKSSPLLCPSIAFPNSLESVISTYDADHNCSDSNLSKNEYDGLIAENEETAHILSDIQNKNMKNKNHKPDKKCLDKKMGVETLVNLPSTSVKVDNNSSFDEQHKESESN